MPNLSGLDRRSSHATPGWFGLRGRLSRRLVSVAIPDFARRDVFCCGPAAFMDETRLVHVAEGGRKEAFHTEAFGPRQRTCPAPADPAARKSRPYQLRIGRSRPPCSPGRNHPASVPSSGRHHSLRLRPRPLRHLPGRQGQRRSRDAPSGRPCSRGGGRPATFSPARRNFARMLTLQL